MNPLRTTEAATLARCEKAWDYRYNQGKEDQASAAMGKGTLWHAVWDVWWTTDGGIMQVDWARVISLIPEDRRDEILGNEKTVADINWLAQRYDEWRGHDAFNTDWIVIEQELELEGDFGGWTFQGRLDDIRLHKPTDKLYVGECKTMRDWRRMDYLDVDPQLTNYVALAQANGYPVVGVMFDAAKTYRWTRDEHKHSPSDSFQEVMELRTPEQIEANILDMKAIDDRRHMIVNGARPVRNIGKDCSYCSFRDECFASLAFPTDEVEWSDS